MKVILVDATTYSKELDAELADLKQKYFQIKNYVKNNALGNHVIPKGKTYAIGLLRIATILSRNGHDVSYIHFYDLDEFLSAIDDDPDVIAFSAVCPTIPECANFVMIAKEIFPNTRFVLGGAQVNVAPQLTRRKFPAFDDYSVGFDVHAAEQIIKAELKNIDGPYVDFSFLPYDLKEYLINTCSTLGCPFSCRYCQDHFIPHQEISDTGFISYFKRQLKPGTCVHFFDSILGGSEDRILRICDKIKNTGHSFLLSCDIRAELINERTIKALVSAGFVELRMGLEAADDELLKFNNRHLPLKRLNEAVQLLRANSDVYISLYSAIGFPGTTERTVKNTIELFSTLLSNRTVDEIKNCIFVPYPFDNPRFSSDEIQIIDNDWSNYDRQSKPVYNLKEISSNRLWQLYLEMAEEINKSWMQGHHLTESIVNSQPLYGEYIVENYTNKGKR